MSPNEATPGLRTRELKSVDRESPWFVRSDANMMLQCGLSTGSEHLLDRLTSKLLCATHAANRCAPVLAPLLGTLATAPPASADKGGRRISNNSQDASVARATSSDVENAITSQSQSQIHSHPHPQPIIISAVETRKMEEMGTEIEQPAPSQIREPSAAAPEAVMTPQAPEPAERKPLPSEPAVKDEPLIEGSPNGEIKVLSDRKTQLLYIHWPSNCYVLFQTVFEGGCCWCFLIAT